MLSDINSKVTILIPALNPKNEFINYIKELIDNKFEHIIVINDGSDENCNSIFEKIKQEKQCKVITHQKNEGKGKALKDGLKYFNEHFKDDLGVITVDCDGQHLVKDVIKIAEEMSKRPNNMILGTRDFSEKNVPERSSFGNKVTSAVFKAFYGVKITDTQTGLRGIPISLVKDLQNIQGNRYEYETNMLIYCIKEQIEILEVPIKTIYINENSDSHFRPIRDSAIIYGRILNSFLKYSAISILSFIMDMIIFQMFILLVKIDINQAELIMVATIFARIISSLLNYTLNKKIAFQHNGKVVNTLMRYYSLCIVQMLVSAITVALIYSITKWAEVGIKLVVDTILFIINYRIQKKWVFDTKK